MNSEEIIYLDRVGGEWKRRIPERKIEGKEKIFSDEPAFVRKMLQYEVPLFLGDTTYIPICSEYPIKDSGVDMIYLDLEDGKILFAEFKYLKKQKKISDKDLMSILNEAKHRSYLYRLEKVESIREYIKNCRTLDGGYRYDLVTKNSPHNIDEYINKFSNGAVKFEDMKDQIEVAFISNAFPTTNNDFIWPVGITIEKSDDLIIRRIDQVVLQVNSGSVVEKWNCWNKGFNGYIEKHSLKGNKTFNEELPGVLKEFSLKFILSPKFIKHQAKDVNKYSIKVETKNGQIKKSIGHVIISNDKNSICEIHIDAGFIEDGQSYGINPEVPEIWVKYISLIQWFFENREPEMDGYLKFKKQDEFKEVMERIPKLLNFYNEDRV